MDHHWTLMRVMRPIWTNSLLWASTGGGDPGFEVRQKIDLSTPKSCREGSGSLIVSKYGYVGGSPRVVPVDLVNILVTRALES